MSIKSSQGKFIKSFNLSPFLPTKASHSHFESKPLHLDMVNELLTKRNEFLKENHNWNSVIKYEITHKSFSSEFQLVDDCLGYILLCKKYLKEYAESFLPGYNISEVSLSTNNVNMPDLEKSEHLKRFDELIQKAVFSDDKSGIGKN